MTSSPTTRSPACTACRNRHCDALHWKEAVVLSDFFAVPFDCPLRTDDEFHIRMALDSLEEYDISLIAGTVHAAHNYLPRCTSGGNRKAEAIEYILEAVRRGEGIVLSAMGRSPYQPLVDNGRWNAT